MWTKSQVSSGFGVVDGSGHWPLVRREEQRKEQERQAQLRRDREEQAGREGGGGGGSICWAQGWVVVVCFEVVSFVMEKA